MSDVVKCVTCTFQANNPRLVKLWLWQKFKVLWICYKNFMYVRHKNFYNHPHSRKQQEVKAFYKAYDKTFIFLTMLGFGDGFHHKLLKVFFLSIWICNNLTLDGSLSYILCIIVQLKSPDYNLSKKLSRGGIASFKPLRFLVPATTTPDLLAGSNGSSFNGSQWSNTHWGKACPPVSERRWAVKPNLKKNKKT